MLDYTALKDEIGNRYNIVMGDLVQASDGTLVVSRTLGINTIYIVDSGETAYIVSTDYIGYEYKLRNTDCLTLVLYWRFMNGFKDQRSIYAGLTKKEFVIKHTEGVLNTFLTSGFTEHDSLEYGDVIVYKYDGISEAHVGIYLGDNKILHHLPGKLSSIDEIDASLIYRILRNND